MEYIFYSPFVFGIKIEHFSDLSFYRVPVAYIKISFWVLIKLLSNFIQQS